MRLSGDSLPNYLAKKKVLEPVYVISGSESFLVQESCNLLWTWLRQYKTSVNVEVFEQKQNFVWQELAKLLYNSSCFDQTVGAELRLQDAVLDQSGEHFLHKYLSKPLDNRVLVILVPQLPSNWQKITWLQQIDKCGVLVQVWPITKEQLPSWIANRAKQSGLLIDTASCQFIAEHSVGNLEAASQELDKLLLLYSPGEPIHLEQVIDNIDNNAKYNIFDVIDYVLQGQVEQVVISIRYLQSIGEEPIMLLWAFIRELRLLIEMLHCQQDNVTLAQILAKGKVPKKRHALLQKAVKRYSLPLLFSLLRKAALLDQIIKGAANGEIWQELLDSYLALCLGSEELLSISSV